MILADEMYRGVRITFVPRAPRGACSWWARVFLGVFRRLWLTQAAVGVGARSFDSAAARFAFGLLHCGNGAVT